MLKQLRCSNGHEWEASDNGAAVCPVCGLTTANAQDSATVAFAPPQPASAPDLTARDEDRMEAEGRPHPDPLPQENPEEVTLASNRPADGGAPTAREGDQRKERAAPRIPGYEILGELGRGAMGVIYKARQLKLNRIVALKMILAGGHASAVELQRFRAEAEAIAQLRHPHIVQVYSVGEQGGRPFFAFEYVDGGSLAAKLKGQPQPAPAAARMVEMLAHGIHAAHQAGIVHRDLKPSNVLLGSDGVPRITDFGLAKQLDGGHGKTQTGAILGTPGYMAPEQAGGNKNVGPPADVYALGAILYEMLTGRPPFRAATPLDTVLEVVRAEVVPPRKLQPKLPHDIETICLKCLHKEPAKRYRSALELAEDLRRFQAGEPILARPVSAWERGWKRMRRHPVVAVTAALLLIALGVAGWLCADAAYLLVSNRGRLVVEGIDPGARLLVRGGDDAIALNLNGERRFTLPAGEYVAELEGNPPGLELSAERFKITRNSEEALSVRKEFVGELAQLKGHTGPVAALAVSPDGRHALSGSGPQLGGDRTLRLWDLVTGKVIRTLGKPTTEVLSVAFAPDGVHALSGGVDRVARLWNIETGQEIAKFEGHKGAVYGVAFSPDGQRILTGAADHMVGLWDRETAKHLMTLQGHTDSVRAVAFSPDGQTAASASVDGTLRLWDLKTGAERVEQRGRHGGGVLGLAFSPDGRFVASGGGDAQVRLWDTKTGKLLRRLRGHTKAVTGLAFAPDSKQLVSVSGDRLVRLWDVASGHERAKLTGHADGVLAVAFAPDGRHVLSAGGFPGAGSDDQKSVRGRDFNLRWWAVPRAQPGPPSTAPVEQPGETMVLTGHKGPVHALAYTKDGRYLASGGMDPLVRLWEAENGDEVRTIAENTRQVQGLAFSLDGKRLLIGSAPGSTQLWDVAPGKQPRRLPWNGNLVATAPDGKSALVAGFQQVALLDLDTYQIKFQFFGHMGQITSIAYSPDGKRVLTASQDRTMRLWDITNGRELRRFTGHTDQVAQAVFAPDGKKALSAGHDGSVRLWDLETGDELLYLTGHQGKVHGVAFADDGRRAVSVGQDQTLRVWDLEAEREVQRFTGHTGEIFKVVAAPDGDHVATASADKTVRIWRLPVLGASPNIARGQVVIDTDTPAIRLQVRRGDMSPIIRILSGGSGRPAQLPAAEDYVVEPAPNFPGLRIAPQKFALAAGTTQRIEVRRGPEFAGEVARLVPGNSADIKAGWGAMSNPVGFTVGGDRLLSMGRDGRAHLWDVSGRKDLRTLPGTAGQVLALSPDGRCFLSNSGKVVVLDTGENICTLSSPWLTVPVFSPDGKRLLAGGTDGLLRLWDATSGKELRLFDGAYAGVSAVAVSADGKRALAGGFDGTMRLWDVDSGAELRLFTGHRGAVTSVALSPDGKLALSAGAEDRTARLWDTTTGNELRRLHGHPWQVSGLAFMPDGRHAVSWGQGDPKFILWEVPEGRMLYMSESERDRQGMGWMGAMVTTFPRQGATLAAWAEQDGSICLWQVPDPAGRHPLAPTTNKNKGELVVDVGYPYMMYSPVGYSESVQVRQAGKVVATAMGNGRTQLSLNAGAYELEWKGAPHGAELVPAKFTLSQGGLQVVEVRRGPEFVGEIQRVSTGPTGGPVALLTNGRQCLSARPDGALLLWDLEIGRPMRKLKGHTKAVWGLAATRDGKQAVSASFDGTLRLWDVSTGTSHVCYTEPGSTLLGWLTGSNEEVGTRALAITPDGGRALCSLNMKLRLIDMAAGKLVREWAAPRKQPIVSAALSADGLWALTGHMGGEVVLWNAASGKEEHSFRGHFQNVGRAAYQGLGSVAFSPDGKLAVSGGQDGTARVWDLEARKELFVIRAAAITGQPWFRPSAAADFTPDGRRLLVMGSDGTGRLWDVAARQEAYRFMNFNNGIASSPAFAADGRLVLLGGQGSLALRRLPGPDHPQGQLVIEGNTNFGAQLLIKSAGQPDRTVQAHNGATVLDLKPGEYTLELAQFSAQQGMRLSAQRVNVQAGRQRTVEIKRVTQQPSPSGGMKKMLGD